MAAHSSLFKKIRSMPNRFDYKESYHQEMPFYCSKVKLKKDIVTLGIDEIDPNKVCGKYVEPKDWNVLISEPGTVLIDTRNEYEIEIGTFKNAINPHPENFLNMSMRNSTLKSIKK